MNSNDLLYLGRVKKAHGVKGDILVTIDNENIKFTNDLREIWLGEDPSHISCWNLENINQTDNKVFLKLRYVETLKEADFLKGLNVYIPEEVVTEKSLFDTIGFRLLNNEDNNEIGVVTGIERSAMQDLIVFEHQEEEKLLPAVEEFVKTIDWEKKEIYVTIIEGLI
jgi:16S rRNA processing protein RimM